MTPVLLDLTGRRVVIVGGGAVAARRATAVAGAASITVVAPQLRAQFPPEVAVRLKPYDAADLAGADLVFAATDSAAVNDAVVTDARRTGVWCNRADDNPDLPGDFSTPARFDRGPVVVTVSAGSAALSVAVRDKLAAAFDPAWELMAAAMAELRPEIRRLPDPAARRDAFRRLATDAAMTALARSGIEGLRAWLADRGPG